MAVGAISFYLDRFVKGRILKFTYGTTRNAPHNPLDPEHIKREHKTYVNSLGEKRVRGAFTTMLSKVWHQATTIKLTLLTDVCDGYLGHQGSREPRNQKKDALHPRRGSRK